MEGNTPTRAHLLLQRFIKGAYQSRPALPRYTTIWDTFIVLTYLKGLWLLDKVNLQISYVIRLGHRKKCQTLRYMNLRYMERNSDHSYIFTIHDLVKHPKTVKPDPALELPKFTADDRICVASTRKDYIHRTNSVRGNEEQLFVSFIQPQNKVLN